jgi:hypothetical protein
VIAHVASTSGGRSNVGGKGTNNGGLSKKENKNDGAEYQCKGVNI